MLTCLSAKIADFKNKRPKGTASWLAVGQSKIKFLVQSVRSDQLTRYHL